MKEQIQTVFNEKDDSNGSQTLMMGGTLVALNLFLMLCVGVYWINPSVHQYFSGKAL